MSLDNLVGMSSDDLVRSIAGGLSIVGGTYIAPESLILGMALAGVGAYCIKNRAYDYLKTFISECRYLYKREIKRPKNEII